MEFPPDWECIPRDEARIFSMRLVDFPLQLAALLGVDGGEVGDWQLHLGGTSIIRTRFQADAILGKAFEG